MNESPRIAVIATGCGEGSHARLIIESFWKGIPLNDQEVKDQTINRRKLETSLASVHINEDLGYFPELIGDDKTIFYGNSIPEALKLGRNELAVDGVILVDEGENNFEYMKQVCRVLKEAGRGIPIFIDKIIAKEWEHIKKIRSLGEHVEAPLLGGSSIPLCWTTGFEYDPGEAEKALVFTEGLFPSYAIHGLEVAQFMAEARYQGRETAAVESVSCLEGVKAIDRLAGDGSLWSSREGEGWLELAEKASSYQGEGLDLDKMKDYKNPALIHIRYEDGFETVVLIHHQHANGFSYAYKVGDRTDGTRFITPTGFPHRHISGLLCQAANQHMLGNTPYPFERSLVTTEMRYVAQVSLNEDGRTVKAPDNAPYDLGTIRYTPPDRNMEWLERGPVPGE